MTIEEVKSTPEAKVCDLAAEVWNEIGKIADLPDNDLKVLNENIHRIQDMMYQRMFVKIHGKL